ncbi:MAG: hypothetical protein RL219_193 [Actinomycetota bacterium]
MSALTDIWALEQAANLTDDERADAIALTKANAWAGLSVPVTVGTITLSALTVRGPVVEFTGEGGTVDWPLRLINAPIAVPDAAGVEVDPWGQAWRVDLLAVLTSILDRFQ